MARVNVTQKTGKESHGDMHRVGKWHPDFPVKRETFNLETRAAETSGLSQERKCRFDKFTKWSLTLKFIKNWKMMKHGEFFISGKFEDINYVSWKGIKVDSAGGALQLYYLLFLLKIFREFLSKRGILRPFWIMEKPVLGLYLAK